MSATGVKRPVCQNVLNGLLDSVDDADEWREIKNRDFFGAQPDKSEEALRGVILQTG